MTRLQLQRRIQQFLCKHRDVTNKLTVSGYGYTEYRVWFCQDCAKAFTEQTREQQ